MTIQKLEPDYKTLKAEREQTKKERRNRKARKYRVALTESQLSLAVELSSSEDSTTGRALNNNISKVLHKVQASKTQPQTEEQTK